MDQKIGDLLNMSFSIPEDERKKTIDLDIGYLAEENLWDVIIRYTQIKKDKVWDLKAVVYLMNNYAIVTGSKEQIEKLAQDPEIEYIEKPKRLFFARDNMEEPMPLEKYHQRKIETNLTGAGVLIAVIDSGIDFRNAEFIDENGDSRILYLWDQGAKGEMNGLFPPKGYEIGIEYTKKQLDSLLRAPMTEKEPKDFSGHGTAVAGIAAGSNIGIAPKSELIIVKIGNARNGVSGFPRTTELMQGIDYVLKKALERSRPVVINLSFGNNYGGHDGYDILSEFINDASMVWKNVICIGTGNEGDKGGHTSGTIKSDQKEEIIEFTVGAYEKTLNIQIWKSPVDTVDYIIESPSGIQNKIEKKNAKSQRILSGNNIILAYIGDATPNNISEEIYFDFIPHSDEAYLESGIWKIKIIPRKIVDGRYDAWMPVSEVLNSKTRFLYPKSQVTLTIPSTAHRAISVGAYDENTYSSAPFSGRGYLRNLSIVKPDISAPGVKIYTCMPKDTYRFCTGTSFAVPYVTGTAALLMQAAIVEKKDVYLYGEKMKALLISNTKYPNSEKTYPNNKLGWGILDMEKVLRAINDYEKI